MTDTINSNSSFVAIPVHVRLADTDMFRHINNVSYLAFIESIRLDFFRSNGCDLRTELALTRKVSMDFLRPATFHDPLVGLIKVIGIGRSSLDLEIKIANADDHSIVYVECTTSQIHCCAKTGKVVPVGEPIRELLRKIGQLTA